MRNFIILLLISIFCLGAVIRDDNLYIGAPNSTARKFIFLGNDHRIRTSDGGGLELSTDGGLRWVDFTSVSTNLAALEAKVDANTASIASNSARVGLIGTGRVVNVGRVSFAPVNDCYYSILVADDNPYTDLSLSTDCTMRVFESKDSAVQFSATSPSGGTSSILGRIPKMAEGEDLPAFSYKESDGLPTGTYLIRFSGDVYAYSTSGSLEVMRSLEMRLVAKRHKDAVVDSSYRVSDNSCIYGIPEFGPRADNDLPVLRTGVEVSHFTRITCDFIFRGVDSSQEGSRMDFFLQFRSGVQDFDAATDVVDGASHFALGNSYGGFSFTVFKLGVSGGG